MRGRLTLEKVNAAINDMATYAEANAHLISAPKKKVVNQLLSLYVLVIRPYILLTVFPFHVAGRKSLGKSPCKSLDWDRLSLFTLD